MKNPILPCLLLTFAGCAGTSSQETSLPRNISEQLERARQHLVGGDPDAALLVTDKLLESDSELRDARLLAAEANVALVQKGRSNTQSLIDDAVRNYELALDIDAKDADTLDSLSDVYRMMKGDYRLGAERALQAAGLHKSNTDPFYKSLLRAAENELMIFKLARNEELKSDDTEIQPETEGKARIVLSRLEKVKQGLPGVGYLKASEVYRWLGKTLDEIDQLERGITAKPDHFPLHARYRELRSQRGEDAQCVAFYRSFLRDRGPNAGMLYSQGMAESGLGDAKRRSGNRDAAQRAYTSAIKSFELCKTNKPEWKDNCNHWLAIEHLALAKLSEEAGEIAVAKRHLEKAFAASPKVTESDANGIPLVMDAFRTHYFGTMMHLARAISSAGTKDSLRDGLEFWEGFLELFPEKYGWMYNNAAFNARDYGTAIETSAANGTEAEKRKAAEEAMKIYERSYELYRIASRLEPDDARIVNDTGLMLIYHLKRDYETAKNYFDQAIKVGLAKLETLDDKTPEDERNLLEEAIGDAYQNIGKMYMDLGKDFEEYAPMLKESIRYYPKQQRQSVMWLRRGAGQKSTQDAAKPQVDPREAKLKPIAEAAKKKAEAKDFDGALLALDAVSEKMTGYAPYHYYQGLYALRYAKQSMRKGGSAGQIDGLLADARNNLQRAVEIDGEPVEPRLHLAEANYESSEFENAAKISSALVLHISSRGGAEDDVIAATQRVRALSGYRLFIAAKQKGEQNADELNAARNAFRNLERMGELDAAARKSWASLEQWAGAKAAAMDIYARQVAKNPTDHELLGEYLELARTTQQAEHAIREFKKRSDAVTMWYLGRALYYRSFEKEPMADPKLFERVLSQAFDAFEVSATHNREFAASCRTWQGIVFGRKGFFALNKKLWEIAESDFLTAAERAPAQFTAPAYGKRSVKDGIQLIVHHYYTAEDLPKAVAFLQKVCALRKSDAGFANNLGLFARDHGIALQRDAKADEAKKMFEISLEAYERAANLEPDSVRQRNDLIVVKLYYLKRDLEGVVPTLTDCIRDGEKQLAEDPPTDKQELQDLQEAVGDSYENLGFYHMTFGEDPKAARKNLEKSLEFYPFKQRRSTAHLRKLDGGE